jgi:hypothetical protein
VAVITIVLQYAGSKRYMEEMIMVTRSTPRQDDATLQVKKNPCANSTQARQESEKSNGDSTQLGKASSNSLRMTAKLHRQEMGHLLGTQHILCPTCKYFIESVSSLLDVIKVI